MTLNMRKSGYFLHMQVYFVWISWCALQCMVEDNPNGRPEPLGIFFLNLSYVVCLFCLQHLLSVGSKLDSNFHWCVYNMKSFFLFLTWDIFLQLCRPLSHCQLSRQPTAMGNWYPAIFINDLYSFSSCNCNGM